MYKIFKPSMEVKLPNDEPVSKTENYFFNLINLYSIWG